MKKGALKKSIALCCSITVLATSIPFTAINIKAATGDFFDENNSVMIDKGGYKKEVFGVRTDDWGVNWTDRKESLPPSKVYLIIKRQLELFQQMTGQVQLYLTSIQSHCMHILLHIELQVMVCRWHHRL